MKIYLAAPLFSQAEKNWNKYIASLLRECGHDVFLPQEHEQHRATTATIFRVDLGGLESAEGVVALLDGTDVDSGTAWECGYASAANTPIFGLRTDPRRFSKDERVNLMIQESCTKLFTEVEDLIGALSELRR